jgi:mRNA interferase MazF
MYWVRFEPRSGSEQRGMRPGVVVSTDTLNQIPTWKSLQVVPLSTSGRQSRLGPTVVFLSKGSAGLQQDSLALAHQITTIDRGKLVQPMGKLSDEQLRALDEALKVALSLD